MTQVRALIVDDEPLSRRALRQLLDTRADVDVQHEVASAAEAAPLLSLVDVAFVDIEMPGMSGLDLVRAQETRACPFIVFVTAFNEYAVTAFETDAVDYLPKPVSASRLAKAMDRVHERLVAARQHTELPAGPPALIARVGDRDVVIPVEDIDAIEADGVYAVLIVASRRYLIRTPLDTLETTLDGAGFLRVHRSWIVSRSRIASVRPMVGSQQRELVLRTGAVIPVSRRRQAAVLRAIRQGAR